MYLRTASGKLLDYDGDRSKEDIIKFIETNRDKIAEVDSKPKAEADSKPKDSESDSEAKDEL